MELSDHYPLTSATTHAATASGAHEAASFKDTTRANDVVIAEDPIVGTHNQDMRGQFLGEDHFVFNYTVSVAVGVTVVTCGSGFVPTTIFGRDGGGLTGAGNGVHGTVTRIAFQIASGVSASVQRAHGESPVDSVASASLKQKQNTRNNKQ